MKLNIKNLRAVMTELAHNGDQESYDELWKAIVTLNNLGLVSDAIRNAAIQEDHRLFETGEAAPICDGTFDLKTLEI